MNTKQMRYVIEASQTLNFNQAATNLFVSQPALSYQIKSLEDEIGFKIFHRMGKSVQLTQAGKQFTKQITRIYRDLHDCIEEGQNLTHQFKDNLTIAYPTLSCLPMLPQVINRFNHQYPQVLINPQVNDPEAIANFKSGAVDILFASKKDLGSLPEGNTTLLYNSPIYALVNQDDPLSHKAQLTSRDFQDRTLLVNGGSSDLLKHLQQRVIIDSKATPLNSPNHAATLVNVAANRAVCLVPGYLKEPTKGIAWVPFQTDQYYDCYLITHRDDHRKITRDLLHMLIANH